MVPRRYDFFVLIHHHLPKTAGTTFNFGILPQVLPPQHMLLLGSEMPVKKVGDVKPRHLRRKVFLSGHGLADADAPRCVRDLNLDDNSFRFGFARPSHQVLPSLLDQLTKFEPAPKDYDALNDELYRYYLWYVTGAEMLLNNSGSVLLRSATHSEFYGNLSYLNELLNLPVCVSPPRNTRSEYQPRLDMNKVVPLDWSVVDEIYFRAEEHSRSPVPEERSFSHVSQPPKKHDVVQEIFGDQVIAVSSENMHVLWLNENPSLSLTLHPISRVDKSGPLTYCGTGRRKDLDRHEPVFQVEGLSVPPRGLGFSLRYPFNQWSLQSNYPGKVIGQLLSYRVHYL